ncbi:phospholipase D-like domain-containing protein [Opitutus sp. ER46]|uniref:phospholipase D-like domain-containing protein n=1 Tax=Opitutus sp. ER46 TaxID=2161864 RepID=UPI000D30591B|nr:phospholipase D-like domain-containing protein [Opitutus sp. ER46]PTX98655.1 cardiolipin synthase B [Opitutus sp. ER46]
MNETRPSSGPDAAAGPRAGEPGGPALPAVRIDDRMRALAEPAFARSAGAPLIPGNDVRLLRDAGENYPAWLAAIAGARHHIHFENYILADDTIGNRFADALIERARAGVSVRVIYDWLGVFRKASRAFWARLRAGGVEVRGYNPPRLESPLGWVSRDHRKLLVVDGEIGFISGLCVADMWTGNPARNIAPWRDTGVTIRGPALADMERAFARNWATLGAPLPDGVVPASDTPVPAAAGNVSLRIVASDPTTSGTFRLDQLVVAFARKRVWLTDAYYLGAPTYVQALVTSARDGVDVRMLFTRGSDIPVMKMMSRTGYRALLEAGIRIFEWNGSLLHAKTAVIDGHWSRVGSTNLNFASWMGNCELDAVIEDAGFGQQMEAMYLDDLSHATEIVLEQRRRKLRKSQSPAALTSRDRKGSATRAAAGAVRIGNVLGAALTNRRVIEPIECRLLAWTAVGLLGFAVLCVLFPRVFAYPTAALLVWVAGALLYRAAKLVRRRRPKNGG